MAVKLGATKWNAGDQVLAQDLNDTLEAIGPYALQKVVTGPYTINPDTESFIILKTGAVPTLPNPAGYVGKVLTIILVSGGAVTLYGTGATIYIPHISAGVSSIDIYASSTAHNSSYPTSKFWSDGSYWYTFS